MRPLSYQAHTHVGYYGAYVMRRKRTGRLVRTVNYTSNISVVKESPGEQELSDRFLYMGHS
jgi:hypothetical protein